MITQLLEHSSSLGSCVFKDQELGFRMQDLWFWVYGLGFRLSFARSGFVCEFEFQFTLNPKPQTLNPKP